GCAESDRTGVFFCRPAFLFFQAAGACGYLRGVVVGLLGADEFRADSRYSADKTKYRSPGSGGGRRENGCLLCRSKLAESFDDQKQRCLGGNAKAFFRYD